MRSKTQWTNKKATQGSRKSQGSSQNHRSNNPSQQGSQSKKKEGEHTTSGARWVYESTKSGLVWNKQTSEGRVRVPLTNFPAKIISDVVEDDGVETQRFLEIEATVDGKTQSFTIPASQFHSMNWPTEHLGPRAIVTSGYNAKDHTRAAIQTLSMDIATRRIYTHTGWTRLAEGEWVYLHAGGALGAVGAVSNIGVQIGAGLAKFSLPEPPQGADLVEAIRASMRMLKVGDPMMLIPLFAAIWRSVLGPASFSLHLAGPTGAMKTTLAALAQQHFGPELDASSLPGSWSSTANALEGLCFSAKDLLLVIDDFCPRGTFQDQQRFHALADRLLRAQGNQSGRQRMRSDATLRPAKPPRGLILSTGEDIPTGQSLRARMLILEVSPGVVFLEPLNQCQQDAGNGLYTQAMAGFLQWLAPQYDQVKKELTTGVPALRTLLTQGQGHLRTPDILANLVVGLDYFCDFAKEKGAITETEAQQSRQICWDTLVAIGKLQQSHQGQEDPVPRFFELLAAAMTSGQAHLASVEGGAPENPQAAGWREDYGFSQATHRPQGKRIGWTDERVLYLHPGAAFAVAQTMGREMGDPLTVTSATLRKRLKERGVIETPESRQGRHTIRKHLEGKRMEVLFIPLDPSIQKVPQVHQLYQLIREETEKEKG